MNWRKHPTRSTMMSDAGYRIVFRMDADVGRMYYAAYTPGSKTAPGGRFIEGTYSLERCKRVCEDHLGAQG